MALPRSALEDPLGGLEWPDGPVCPFCGTRERVSPEIDGAFVRVRYDCLRCDRHHGYIRRRPRVPGSPGHRVLPRLPDPGV
jgi:hypothetical protein